MSYSVAIMIPCYNEELTIETVVNMFETVCKEKEDFEYKIFVYDNNSTDNTVKIVQNINSKNVILKSEFKQGKGYVIRRMFQEIDADCYILVDGDNTYSAKDCLEMIRNIKEENYDMVVGDRLSTDYFKENKRLFHSFGNVLVSKLINRLFHSNIKDIMSGYRAFSRKFVKTSGFLAEGFEIETEISILALDGNYKIKEIPISYKNRVEGSNSKLNTFFDGIKVIKTIFTLFKDYRSFEFFFIMFSFFAICATVFFIPIFIEYLNTGLVPRFPTLFVSIFFALLAILAMCIGIILSSIVKFKKRHHEVILLNYKKENRK